MIKPVGYDRVGITYAVSYARLDELRTWRDAMMQDDIKRQLIELIERYRLPCLWFLAEDFVPATPEQAIQVLDYIERYGDREGFVQARRLKQWLSPSISETSAS